MKTITILGAGWLGTALAKKLQSNYQIKVSTRTVDKQKALIQNDLNAFITDFNTDATENYNVLFHNVDVLIVSLTPQPNSVFKKIEKVIQQYQIKQVLLFSSTGIYGDLEGNVHENTQLNTHLPRVALLKEIEDLFLQNSNFNTTVLRLGGLIGGDRHPVKSLARKDQITDGNEPVNIAYRDRIIKIIESLLSDDLPNDVFNYVEDDHRTKEVYYTEAAEKYQLKLPKFISNAVPKNRIVSAEKINAYIKKNRA